MFLAVYAWQVPPTILPRLVGAREQRVRPQDAAQQRAQRAGVGRTPGWFFVGVRPRVA